jgi:hypothetical protein
MATQCMTHMAMKLRAQDGKCDIAGSHGNEARLDRDSRHSRPSGKPGSKNTTHRFIGLTLNARFVSLYR